MTIPIVPAVVIGGVVYYASTHKTGAPDTAPPGAPPPGQTVEQTLKQQKAARRALTVGAAVAPYGNGALSLDPQQKQTTQPGSGSVDPGLQKVADAAIAKMKADFEAMDEKTKCAAVDKINAAVKKHNDVANKGEVKKGETAETAWNLPPLDCDANWKEIAQAIGAAAGGAGAKAGCDAVGLVGVADFVCAPIGAAFGAICGGKIEEWASNLSWDDFEFWNW